MSSKCKNGSECKYCKINSNKQCISCDPHVGITSLTMELSHGASLYVMKLHHEAH
jgi:hypothetical protein